LREKGYEGSLSGVRGLVLFGPLREPNVYGISSSTRRPNDGVVFGAGWVFRSPSHRRENWSFFFVQERLIFLGAEVLKFKFQLGTRKPQVPLEAMIHGTPPYL
nr:hypothetical protein [Tanacetum cinerariifolium]